MNWGGGLVRQLGPWQPTAQDIFSFAAPRPYDPSDVQFIAPDGTPNVTNTRSQYVTEGGGKTVIRSPKTVTVLQRVIDDPRLNTPGRRLSNNLKFMAQRMPMEPGTELTPITSSISQPPEVITTEEGAAEEEEFFGPDTLTVPPYTMPDTSAAPFLTQKQIDQFNKMVDDNKTKGRGLIAQVMDPWKNIWADLSDAEKTLAKSAFATFNKLTLEQQVRELNRPSSIIGTLFRRVQAARGKTQKTISDVLQTIADIAMFASFIF